MPYPSTYPARNLNPSPALAGLGGARDEHVPKTPPGQVTAEMLRLAERLSCLPELLGKLQNKLTPVTRSSANKTEGTPPEATPPPNCGLAQNLRDYTTQLEQSLRQINDLIDAIEL